MNDTTVDAAEPEPAHAGRLAKIRGGSDAFPTLQSNLPGIGLRQSGMTLREHFAALAMQGLISNVTALGNLSLDGIAETAVELADALLIELAKGRV